MPDLPLFDPFKVLEEVRRGATQELPQQLPQHPAEEYPLGDQQLKPTSAASAASAGSMPAHELAPARVNEVVWKNSSSSSNTYARSEAPDSVDPQPRGYEAAEVAEAAENQLRHCNTAKIPDACAAEVSGEDLRKWRAGLSGLSPERPPCPGYRREEWLRVLTRALAFLDEFGAQAVALGWTAPRLFGVHPVAGAVRVDACGGLMIGVGDAVRAISAETISFGHLTYRAKPGQPVGVPVWKFGR